MFFLPRKHKILFGSISNHAGKHDLHVLLSIKYKNRTNQILRRSEINIYVQLFMLKIKCNIKLMHLMLKVFELVVTFGPHCSILVLLFVLVQKHSCSPLIESRLFGTGGLKVVRQRVRVTAGGLDYWRPACRVCVLVPGPHCCGWQGADCWRSAWAC